MLAVVNKTRFIGDRVVKGGLLLWAENGIDWDNQITVDQFRITRLQIKFLNPDTRKEKLNKMHLVHLN